jgi:hypothetical protein
VLAGAAWVCGCIRQALAKALTQAASSPSATTSLLDALIKNVTVDDQLGHDVLGLANRLRTLGDDGVQGWTLPSDGGWVGNQQVLFLREAEAQPLLDYFRGLGPPPPPTSVPAGGPGLAVPLSRTAASATTIDPSASCQ